MGLWAETQPPAQHSTHTHVQHAHTRTCRHTPKCQWWQSHREGTSFQYGLLLGAPDAATRRPLLRDPLICDKSCPCVFIILFHLQNPISTPPNCLLVFFCCCCCFRHIAPSCSTTCLFEVTSCLRCASLNPPVKKIIPLYHNF